MHAVKAKYTKRVDKWKGRVSVNSVLNKLRRWDGGGWILMCTLLFAFVQAQLGQTLSAHNGEFRSGLRKVSCCVQRVLIHLGHNTGCSNSRRAV